MYRRLYGASRPKRAPKGKGKRKGYGKGKKRSCSRRYPWYGKPRCRPKAEERDWILFCRGKGLKPEDEPEPVVEESDSDEEEVTEVEKLEEKLHVVSVDLHIDENTAKHYTERYACTEKRTRNGEEMPAELVIRRGFDFKMTVNFDRPYDIKENDITLSFNLSDELNTNDNLHPSFKVDETGKNTSYKFKKWGATVVGQKGNSLTMNVFVPASAPVGEWDFSIRTTAEFKDKKPMYMQYNHDQDINIIFNPWCKEDWVYFPDEDWRNETVLNDCGVQYRGSYSTMGAKAWFFGQFEDNMLDAAFHLVRKGFSGPCSAMGNAVKVTRAISQVVNDCDDLGVLSGNWSGKYEGGTSPGDWAGSVRILRQYMDTGKPVKYGQCWVFSAVVTTVCRALGIPCRSVTNFASAHNTDMEHLSIDRFTKNVGRESNDSVWNFHVWNEVFIARPDLSDTKHWDGWQVIDATPQELSDGVYCCGPAPVKAIKEGELKIGYDTSFIFAEVNADKKCFRKNNETGKIEEIKFLRETSTVGKFVSTHMPTGAAFGGSSGSDDANVVRDKKMERCDLTDAYKYDEGSDKEREIVRKAEKMFQVMNGTLIILDDEADEAEDEETPSAPPVSIQIDKPLPVLVGNPFSFKADVRNISNETIAIKDVVIQVVYKTYDGQEKGVAEKKKVKDIYLDSNKTETFSLTVDDHVACARPEDSFLFELQVFVSFYDRDDVQKETDFRLRRPDVLISGLSSCKLGETVEAELSFTNPLKIPLTNCRVKIDGGFDLDNLKDDTIEIAKINAKGSWKQTISMTPRRHPRGQKYRALSVGFRSDQLDEIDGNIRIQLNDK